VGYAPTRVTLGIATGTTSRWTRDSDEGGYWASSRGGRACYVGDVGSVNTGLRRGQILGFVAGRQGVLRRGCRVGGHGTKIAGEAKKHAGVRA
jgi:hypothetical protein